MAGGVECNIAGKHWSSQCHFNLCHLCQVFPFFGFLSVAPSPSQTFFPIVSLHVCSI